MRFSLNNKDSILPSDVKSRLSPSRIRNRFFHGEDGWPRDGCKDDSKLKSC